MSKKKLPKAVTKTAEDMRKSGLPAHAGEGAGSPPITPDEVVTIADAAAAAQRFSRAIALVERYSNFSALGGVIPIPLVNVAGLTAINVRMVKELCAHYGIPYEPGRARALIVGLAAGAVPTTAAAVTTSTLIFFVPAVNMLGLAVSSVTASACTRGIGRRFADHFERGGTLIDFPVVERK